MKTTISTLAVLLIFAGSSVLAQQSDYQVQQDFKADLEEITERLNSAVTAEDVEEIRAHIEQLEADYSDHQALVNASLYPQTFESVVSDLRSNLEGAETNINTINELNERIESLQSDIAEFRSQFAEMDEDSQALRQRLERASANERRLSGLVTQYRQNLENRDEFVSDFLENLLNRYQAMDSQAQSEIAEVSERLEDDPIGLLRTIIGEYINQANDGTGLEAPDYLRMRAQHAYFETVWDRIGDRLANAYSPGSPVQTRGEIADLLAAWEASINNQLYDGLTVAFSENGIDLPAFTSDDTFRDALNTFVDNATETARQQNEEADAQLHESFNNYWNSVVKADWGEFLTTGNVLTSSEIAAIDVKVGEWGREAQPVSNLMFILFLISLAVIIGLVVLLITKKS